MSYHNVTLAQDSVRGTQSNTESLEREVRQQRSTINHLQAKLEEAVGQTELQSSAFRTRIHHLETSLAQVGYPCQATQRLAVEQATKEAEEYYSYCVEHSKHFSSLKAVLAAVNASMAPERGEEEHRVCRVVLFSSSLPQQGPGASRQAEIIRHLQEKVDLLHSQTVKRNRKRRQQPKSDQSRSMKADVSTQ